MNISYKASCPFVPNAECQACDELTDYNRIVTCCTCHDEGRITLASIILKNAWSITTDTKQPVYAVQHCDGFIFCNDCFDMLGIEGYCSKHQ